MIRPPVSPRRRLVEPEAGECDARGKLGVRRAVVAAEAGDDVHLERILASRQSEALPQAADQFVQIDVANAVLIGGRQTALDLLRAAPLRRLRHTHRQDRKRQ